MDPADKVKESEAEIPTLELTKPNRRLRQLELSFKESLEVRTLSDQHDVEQVEVAPEDDALESIT